MIKHPVFALYGVLLIGFACAANFFGWSWSRPAEVRGVPKSVRDNPGIYRSIYSGYGRYSGGK